MDEMSVRAPMATPGVEGSTGKPMSRRSRPGVRKPKVVAPKSTPEAVAEKESAETGRPSLDVLA